MIKEKLQKTDAEYMVLNLDDRVVHIPWELLYDGKQFLCQRFNIGRLVKTRQTIHGIKNRKLARPLKMLALVNPEGDLDGAQNEVTQLRDLAAQNRDWINLSLADESTPDFIKEKIRNFDLVHFAGHVNYNLQHPEESGWCLRRSSFSARDITNMEGTVVMPALIFSNACQSARTEPWILTKHYQDDIFGLANAFLLAGVKHYVGTFWEIQDEPSSLFALEFYKHLLNGGSIGEALRSAREALIRKYGEETVVWASYVLYGDPTTIYVEPATIMDQEKIERKEDPHKTFDLANAFLLAYYAQYFGQF